MTLSSKKGKKLELLYSNTGATPKTVLGGYAHIQQPELNRIYGPAKHTHIYTGEISHVGSQHIEYTINTFEGCSRAIVFLLGCEAQPADLGVMLKDVGKAIAVHTGVHPRKIKNFGFKFNAKPLSL